MLNTFSRAIQHPLTATLNNCFLQCRVDDYPDMSYLGLNFNGDLLESVKFYFATYKPLLKSEVLYFLPQAEDFLRYYAYYPNTNYRSDENIGCTFTLKFHRELGVIRGFHFRMGLSNENYKLATTLGADPFLLERMDGGLGINYEYSQGAVKTRFYYTFRSLVMKKYFADFFDYPFLKDALVAEVASSKEDSKVIAHRFDKRLDNINRPDLFSSEQRSLIDKITDEFGFFNAFDGVYKGCSRLSTYFFNTKGDHKNDIFKGKENYHMDTVTPLLCNS